MGESRQTLARNREGEACLSDPAGAGHGDKAMFDGQFSEFMQFVAPAD
jgi:hypothetical protein